MKIHSVQIANGTNQREDKRKQIEVFFAMCKLEQIRTAKELCDAGIRCQNKNKTAEKGMG